MRNLLDTILYYIICLVGIIFIAVIVTALIGFFGVALVVGGIGLIVVGVLFGIYLLIQFIMAKFGHKDDDNIEMYCRIGDKEIINVNYDEVDEDVEETEDEE